SDLDPAVAALVAECDVCAQLPPEGLRVVGDGRVLVGDREHRDADVRDGGGGLHWIGHALKTGAYRRSHRELSKMSSRPWMGWWPLAATRRWAAGLTGAS